MSYRLFKLSLILIILFVSYSWAGVTGKISGEVIDGETGEPIISADVEVINPATGQSITGAATDLDGFYFILNIRPGIFDLRASAMGYSPTTVKNVIVKSDRTTTINFKLVSKALRAKEIIVTAEREPIQMDVTTSETHADADQIETMPVTSVTEIISHQVGVISQDGQLHFRGGRAREVSYKVDGMPVQDPTYGNRAIRVSTSAVQEIRTMTGAFNAEHGGALSAVVSIVTKEGDPNKMSGSFGYSTSNFRIDALNKHSSFSDKLDMSLSGPEPISTYFFPLLGFKLPRDKRISYFISVTGENYDGRLPLNRAFDLSGPPIATLDEINSPYKVKYGWYGFFPERRVNTYETTIKLKQKITPAMKLILAYTGNWQKYRYFDWGLYYTPNSMYVIRNNSHQINLTLTHNVSPRTFYEARIGYLTSNTTQKPNDLCPGDFYADSSIYRNMDDWYDINNDGKPQIRVPWWDANGNGMYDYGESWQPLALRVDTIWKDPATREDLLRIDTIAVDSIPPQPGEEPWWDWNRDGVFEPRMTNFRSPLGGVFYLGERFMDGEPFLDAFPYGISYENLLKGIGPFPFVMETLWIDIDGNGRKDYGEFVFGSYFDTPGTTLIEEYTWVDSNGDDISQPGEYIDINMDGVLTFRDGWCNYVDANGNGKYDVGEYGEPFLDLNGNGYWDPPNFVCDDWTDKEEFPSAVYPGELYIDRNGNRKYDSYSGFQYRGFSQWAVWHKRKSEVFMIKGDVTSQMDRNNQFKSGLEIQLMKIDMNEIQYPEAYYDGIPDNMPWSNHGVFRFFYTRSPMSLAYYLQDKMEYGGLIANIGIRFDLFIQAKEILVDSMQRELESELSQWWDEEDKKVAKSAFRVSPRLGMSYPITERSKLFFSYGHFYQLPGLDKLYQTANQGSSAGRILGNSNLSYEKTVAYELGVAYAFTKVWTVKAAGYYKDIYDLVNTSQLRIGPIQQSVYVNSDYARSRGFEFTLEKGLSDYWSLNTNYAYSFAFGKSSSDRSGYDALFNQTAIPLRDLPLNWDQRHYLKSTLTFNVKKDEHPSLIGFKLPDHWTLSFILNWSSGLPYTPSSLNPDYRYKIKPGEQAWERTGALRMPAQFKLDMKFNKSFRIGNYDASFFFNVDNLTNKRNITKVYSDTGKPDYSWVEWKDEDGDGIDETYVLHGTDYDKNPGNWSAPTDIRFGLELSW